MVKSSTSLLRKSAELSAFPSVTPVAGHDEQVEVVVAHTERATLRVGDVFLKVDADPERVERELAVMARVPVPTPEVLWHRPPVLALAALPGTPLGRLGGTSSAPPSAWRAVGAAIRRLHTTPPPPWPSRNLTDLVATLDAECAWLVDHEVVPADVVERNRALAEVALQPRKPVFVHGDLQVEHVFTAGDEVTGILDWSEGGSGDAQYDLAVLTLGYRDRLPDLVAGYGGGADPEAVRGWWSARSLGAIRWLVEHGFDPAAPGCEIDVLRAQVR